jgi:hypothetical protein
MGEAAMLKQRLTNALLTFVFCTLPSIAMAQWAESGVDVGPGHAGGSASADGQWTFVDSSSRVNGINSLGHGVAIGAGPDGISFSHSIGFNSGGVGAGHNLNMTIGQNGTHVSNGQVVTQGGNSRVVVGGGSGQFGGGISGGSTVTGYGDFTYGQSHSHTQLFPRLYRPFGG